MEKCIENEKVQDEYHVLTMFLSCTSPHLWYKRQTGKKFLKSFLLLV